MALQRTVSKALACNGCQQWLLRSFIAAVGGSPLSRTTAAPIRQRRAISHQPRRMNEARERIQKEEEHVLNEINEDVNTTTFTPTQPQPPEPEPAEETPESSPDTESMPWYLRVQQPSSPESINPLAARQQIPDLPAHPPTLLSPLLTHISSALGLDSLTLLDLRSLDPPPALGGNLLMILGTARSEKHLHVSADKLCRWLRTEYKLRPYADGLLGRNELKLKMRRKAKRSRLLSAVGAKPTGETEIDDGIRTGWVCVNIGRVEGGELPEQVEKVQRAEGVVGFGASTEGCSVVVQMLTEEKREELDLEKLWMDMLGRARREKESREREGEAGGVDATSESASAAAAPASEQTLSSIGQQARAFHTATSTSPATYV